jgi:hypothetical protein
MQRLTFAHVDVFLGFSAVSIFQVRICVLQIKEGQVFKQFNGPPTSRQDAE